MSYTKFGIRPELVERVKAKMKNPVVKDRVKMLTERRQQIRLAGSRQGTEASPHVGRHHAGESDGAAGRTADRVRHRAKDRPQQYASSHPPLGDVPLILRDRRFFCLDQPFARRGAMRTIRRRLVTLPTSTATG